ncbi:MAG TPA: DUF3558 domain-containing protein [Amycolatopsis sp.]|uniref:DUF3558 domain-containing protein n=1 Tax=Amycolatopsis sp. TaxID=37632 RepID=UPI002B46BF64|nr:DUF3558 domain-containing protein [Amycolatopsis sp.]HKS45570.1 DUF3558 domain-containing protein [Amycolatopsis sp.]
MSARSKGGLGACPQLSAALAVVALAGCTTSVGGISGPAPVAPTSAGLPARTKELSLRGVDPCKLLTAQQLDQLKENGTPRPVARDTQRDGPTCAFDVDAAPPTYTYYLETITNADIDDWLTGSHRKPSMITQPVEVPGFPALINYPPVEGGVQDCETLVGVADGQTLRAQMAPDDSSFSQQQLCEKSTNFAELAVQTLSAAGGK